jgi:hypothetical protein
MDTKLAVPTLIAAAVLLPGTLPPSALAAGPETAGNSTNISPADATYVSIATNGEAVVLRGAVSSDDKDRIEFLAQQYASGRQVINELTVKDF